MSAFLKQSLRSLPYGASTYSRSHVAFGEDAPLYMTHGDGWRAFDIAGNDYVDCIMGLGSVILGHRHPHVDEAIRRQLANGTAFSLASTIEVEAAERVLAHFPEGCQLQWGVNGSDATTGAVRLARAVTGKQSILMAKDGYHGFHDWALAGTKRDRGIPPSPYHHRDDPTNHVDDLAAILIEPDLHPDWLQAIREFCTSHSALMIADETMTWQRYPTWTACSHYGVTPDLWTLGKSLGNGMPTSTIVGPASIMRELTPMSSSSSPSASSSPSSSSSAPPSPPPIVNSFNTFFSSTWAGHPLSMAAVIATLDVMEREDGPARIFQQAQRLNAALVNLGLAPELPFNRIRMSRKTRAALAARGVLVYNAHNLSLAHDENAMERLLSGWKTVADNGLDLADSENPVMRR